MGLPDMNPLAAKLMGGVDFRKKLQEQLLEAADRAEDPAYAARLREAAEGKRPLRSFLNDPGFAAAQGLRTPEQQAVLDERLDEARAALRQSPEELREALRADLTRRGASIPTLEEAKGIFPEVERLMSTARAINAEDEANGWGGTVERLRAEDEARAKQGDPESGKPE